MNCKTTSMVIPMMIINRLMLMAKIDYQFVFMPQYMPCYLPVMVSECGFS